MKDKIINRIYSYSLLSAIYTKYDNDTLADCFIPLLLSLFPDNDWCEVVHIKRTLDDFCFIDELTVEHILERAVAKGLIIKNQNGITYKLKTEVILHYVDDERAVKKRIKDLTNYIEEWNRENGFRSTQKPIEVIFSTVKELELTLAVVDPTEPINHKILKIENTNVKMLFNCLKDAINHNAVHVQTFKEIVQGLLIKNALEWTDLTHVTLHKFRECKVFLDTNIIFSLLGLHGLSFQEQTENLLHNLKFFDFKPMVLDFTLRQIKGFLRNYSPDKVAGIKTENLKIPDAYNTLKIKLKGKTNIKESIEDYCKQIENKLKELEIAIFKSDIKFTSNRPPEDPRLAKMFDDYGIDFAKRKYHYGVGSNKFGKQHDLGAIVIVQQERKDQLIKIADPKAFFLTADRKLALFNHLDMKKPKEEFLPEVILDTGLAGMLWVLGKGQTEPDLPLEQIIAAYSRNFFINRRVWKKFQEVFTKYLQRKNIEIETIPNVFYLNIQNELLEFREDDLDRIDEPYLEEHIEKSCKDHEESIEEHKNIIAHSKRQERVIQELTDENRDLKDVAEALESGTENLKEEIVRLKRINLIIICILFVFILGFCGFIFKIFHNL
jgi:hypothetical protein